MVLSKGLGTSNENIYSVSLLKGLRVRFYVSMLVVGGGSVRFGKRR